MKAETVRDENENQKLIINTMEQLNDVRWNDIASAVDVNTLHAIVVRIVTFEVFDFFQRWTLRQHSMMSIGAHNNLQP